MHAPVVACFAMDSSAKQHYIQIITYIRRRRDLTPEQFYDHWENVHAHKVIPWAEKHGILSYQQVLTYSRKILFVPITNTYAVRSTLPAPWSQFLLPTLHQMP
jgi:hypothetical protein